MSRRCKMAVSIEEQQRVGRWLLGQSLPWGSKRYPGCRLEDFMALEPEDQNILIFKYGLRRHADRTGYSAELARIGLPQIEAGIIIRNETVAKRFGMNSRQMASLRIHLAM